MVLLAVSEADVELNHALAIGEPGHAAEKREVNEACYRRPCLRTSPLLAGDQGAESGRFRQLYGSSRIPRAPELACNHCGCRWFNRMSGACYECGEPVPPEDIQEYQHALVAFHAAKGIRPNEEPK